MAKRTINRECLDFLKRLAENNSREWFAAHKDEFKAIEADIKAFYEHLKSRLNSHDSIEKVKFFRIYRDIRFSSDKTPYKTHFAGSFSRAGAHRRGGYYLRIKPGGSFVAAGFWDPNAEDLQRIRKELERDAASLREITARPEFKSVWGELAGDEVKTAPKGFARDHPDIDLLRKKQFIFVRNFKDKEVISDGFSDVANASFIAIRPYFDLMSEVLTTDLNGVSRLG